MKALAKHRIAMFSYDLPGSGIGFGGVPAVAHQIAQGLASRGHRVVVWCYSPPPQGALYECRRLPGKWLHQTKLGRLLLHGFLGNLLPLIIPVAEVDLLLCHGDSLFAGFKSKPSIRVFHGSALDEAIHATTWVRRLTQHVIYRLERLSAKWGRWNIAVSENTKHRLPGRVDVIYNGIDLNRFRPEPAVKTVHPSLLFVGTFHGRKRGHRVIEVFESLKERIPGLTLNFVGALPVGMNGVTEHVRIGGEKLVELYQRSWLLVAPSTYEGFGLPYLEAMACGTPMVAAPNPGSQEITESGKWGCLAADNDFETTVEQLLVDEVRRAEWIAKGIERARVYDGERTLDAYEAVIAKAVGR